MIEPFVDAGWLAAHREDVVVADVRWYLDGRSGRAAYDGGHLPGAVWVDLDAVLSGEGSDAAGRQPLADPEVFAAGLATLGIGDDTTVIAYDDDSGAIAARLVWMLRATGHDAALLDGGLKAWEGELETAAPQPAPATFTPAQWPADLVATIDDAADTGANVVIDARGRDRFEGAADAVDPRAGHIPGAQNLPCRGHVGEDGRLLPEDRLLERFAAVGIVPEGDPVVSSCGAGVTACLNLLVMEHVGLSPGRLFPGSWSQYSRDPSRSVETGPAVPR